MPRADLQRWTELAACRAVLAWTWTLHRLQRGFRQETGRGLGLGPRGSLDLLMNSGAVAMGAELLQFQPFGGVAAILLGGVTRHTRRTLGGVGPALGALKSDNEPDALVFGHGKDVAPRARNEVDLAPYLLTVTFSNLSRALNPGAPTAAGLLNRAP